MSNKFRIGYSALGMSDEIKVVPCSSRAQRNVNFPPETLDSTPVSGSRRGSKFFQRPRSMSVWSDISRSSMKLDERYIIIVYTLPAKSLCAERLFFNISCSYKEASKGQTKYIQFETKLKQRKVLTGVSFILAIFSQ
jgi:hypothetical protein